jgi:hypothetical protein
MLVEVVEALLWKRPLDLMPVEMAGSDQCSARNAFLTAIIFLCSIAWQPFLVLLPCRRTGCHSNFELLRLPEMLAASFGVLMVFFWVYTLLLEHPKLVSLAQHEYFSYRGQDTCTYIGRHGHLQWSIALVESTWLPKGRAYLFLFGCCALARPFQLFGGLVFGMTAFYMLQLAYYETFEAASLWCWSALLAFLYCTIQPYVLPCPAAISGDAIRRPHSVVEENEAFPFAYSTQRDMKMYL